MNMGEIIILHQERPVNLWLPLISYLKATTFISLLGSQVYFSSQSKYQKLFHKSSIILTHLNQLHSRESNYCYTFVNNLVSILNMQRRHNRNHLKFINLGHHPLTKILHWVVQVIHKDVTFIIGKHYHKLDLFWLLFSPNLSK